MIGTLKSHTDFKTKQLLKKPTQQHEILHAKNAHQDLLGSFCKSLKKILEAEICCFIIPQNAWNTLYFLIIGLLHNILKFLTKGIKRLSTDLALLF